MELFNGLPHRTIYLEKDGQDTIFGVSTEEVGELITREESSNLGWINKFDDATSYFVPENIFLSEYDDDVILYIQENIDEEL